MEIKTLQQAILYFSNEKVCVEFISRLKWEDGKPCCPKCGSDNCIGLSTRPVFKCREKGCKKQFSVKVGTPFQDSALPLSKLLVALWMVCNAKNGISSCEVARAIGIHQSSAWHLLHRCREIMRTGSFKKLSGEVESDETYIGGRENFKHRAHIPSSFRNVGTKGKTPVLGMLERGGEVRAMVVENARRKSLEPRVLENVELGSTLYTDQLPTYINIAKDRYTHFSVNHMERYVDGQIHTNGLENFWCLLKRGIKGTYTQIAPFHIDRYLDEQVFRYNNRKTDDYHRFELAVSQMFGKTLTYEALTGTTN